MMTPKSLLRHKRAVSRLDEFGEDTTFHRLLWDDAEVAKGEKIKLVKDNKIKRVVLCTGKVYFDLYEEREKRGINDIYLMRVEQFYPFPHGTLVKELSRFPGAEVVWCQEEPENSGAWLFMDRRLEGALAEAGNTVSVRPRYVGRAAAASPATGSAQRHRAEQDALVKEALTL